MDQAFQTAYFESIAALTFVLNEVTEYIQEAIDVTAESQKISKSLGRTFSLANDELKPALNNLNGTITQKLSVAFAGLEKGLSLNTEEVINLAVEQKILGQEYKKTIALFADLQKSFNFSTTQSNQLSKVLQNTSTKFGVSVEFLVDSLDSFLQKNKDILSVTDLTQPAAEAVTMLRGMFGEGSSNQKDLESFIGLLLSSGTSGIKEISNLGITQERRLLGTAKSAEEFTDIVIAALRKSYDTVQRSLAGVGNAGDVLTNKTLISSTLFEQAGGSVIRLGNQLDDIITAFEEADKNTTDFSQKLAKAFDPLKEGFLVYIEAGTETLDEFFNLIKSGTTKVQDFITNNIENLSATKLATGALISLAAAAASTNIALRASVRARDVRLEAITRPGPVVTVGEQLKTFFQPLTNLLKGAIFSPIATFKVAFGALVTGAKALLLPLLKIVGIFALVGTVVGGFISSIKEGLDLGPFFKGIKDVAMGLFKVFFKIGEFIGKVFTVVLYPVVLLFNKLGGLLSYIVGSDSEKTTDQIKQNLQEKQKIDILGEIASNTASTSQGINDLSKDKTTSTPPSGAKDPQKVAQTFRERALFEMAARILEQSKVQVILAKGSSVLDPDTGIKIISSDIKQSLDRVVEKLGGLEVLLKGIDNKNLESVLKQGDLIDVLKSVDYTQANTTEEVRVIIESNVDTITATAGYGGG